MTPRKTPTVEESPCTKRFWKQIYEMVNLYKGEGVSPRVQLSMILPLFHLLIVIRDGSQNTPL